MSEKIVIDKALLMMMANRGSCTQEEVLVDLLSFSKDQVDKAKASEKGNDRNTRSSRKKVMYFDIPLAMKTNKRFGYIRTEFSTWNSSKLFFDREKIETLMVEKMLLGVNGSN